MRQKGILAKHDVADPDDWTLRQATRGRAILSEEADGTDESGHRRKRTGGERSQVATTKRIKSPMSIIKSVDMELARIVEADYVDRCA